MTGGTHVTAGQLALALTPSGNNAAAIQSLDDRVTAELQAGQQRAGAGGHGGGPGHHGRPGGRARKQHRRAAELADHGSLQQGRPVGLRRAGGRGGDKEHPGRRGPEAVPLQHHGGHERLHRLGQQRHAGHSGRQLRPQDGGGPALPARRWRWTPRWPTLSVTAATLASELASRDATISGLQPSRADASALTAYALQSTVDTSSVVDSKIAGRGGAPGVQDALLRAEPGPGGADGRPLGAQVRVWGQRAKAGLAGGGGDHAAGHGALGGPGLRGAERRREVPMLGDFRQLPAVLDSWAGRPISAPLEHSQLIRDLAGGHRHALRPRHLQLREVAAGRRGGVPHAGAGQGDAEGALPLKPGEASKLLELEVIHMGCYESVTTQNGCSQTQNSPQSMRVWPGLRLIGAGGKIPKGVRLCGRGKVEPDGVRLDNGMRLKNQELLRATRPSHAVTYASCQQLTLHNRVRLDLESCHLRAPSCWRPRTGSTAPPGAPA